MSIFKPVATVINLNEAMVSGDKDLKENMTEAVQDSLIFPPAWMH